MSQPAAKRRRSKKGILFLLLIVALLGTGIWWQFLNPDHDQSKSVLGNITGDEQLDPLANYKLYQEERPLMGSVFKIALYTSEEGPARTAIADAFARAEEINTICSDYDPESELSKLNSRLNEGLFEVSPTLATVLAHARESADATSGLYDPTLGTLTKLWREARDNKVLPDEVALAAARKASGWQHLKVNLADNTVRIDQPGLQLDLGGIAKGFAADQMLAVIKRHGITRAYIAAGGDIRLGDPPPGANTWRVGLRTFGPDLPEFISVANCAVSTSGDLHQFVVIDHERYSHIINPATGLGLRDRIAATVVAPTATQTDPLATFACISPTTARDAFMGGDIAVRIVTISNSTPQDLRSHHFPRVDSR
ncbi:MAG: FAD:protein FMN transferase [Akkermansiaceae bacterium]|nr:FAD:protein FMN transferase [Akkermansiaceae bacterium]